MTDLKKQKRASEVSPLDASAWIGGGRQSFPLACSARLFWSSGSLEVVTASVNCEGFTFFSGIPFALGEHLHCELAVRPFESDVRPLMLSCRARVVRVEQQPQGSVEVACEFEEYFVTPQSPLANH